jgi:hypothetical protein
MEGVDLCEAMILGLESAERRLEITPEADSQETAALGCESICVINGRLLSGGEKAACEDRTGSEAIDQADIVNPELKCTDTVDVSINAVPSIDSNRNEMLVETEEQPHSLSTKCATVTVGRTTNTRLSMDEDNAETRGSSQLTGESVVDWRRGRPAFSQQLPQQVFMSSQTFGASCTRCCAWSPAGDRLAAAGEDAR